jgi:MFS family permease
MAGIAALALAYVLSQFFRSFLAVLTPVLSADLGMTKADLSTASGVFFIVFAIAQFPIGVGLDRYGPRLTGSLLLALGAGSGCILFAVATSPWMISVASGLLGLGSAPVLMAALYIFAHTYKPARFAMLASWMVALGTAGNVLGAAPLAYAVEAFGWRQVMGCLALVSIAVAAAVAALVGDPPGRHRGAGATGFGGYVELLRLKVLWPIIPLTAAAYAPSVGIRGLWAGPYLADLHGAGVLEIGRVTLWMALAMVAGAFLYGPLDQLLGTRKWVAVAGTTVCGAAVVALGTYPAISLDGATLLFLIIGLFGGTYGLLMAHARAFLPPHLIGRGVTLMNFFAIGGVGLMQFATGWIATASTVPGDPAAPYRALFLFIAVALGLALLVYLAARDAPPERRAR